MSDSAAAWMQGREIVDDGRGLLVARRARRHGRDQRDTIRRREIVVLRRGVVELLI